MKKVVIAEAMLCNDLIIFHITIKQKDPEDNSSGLFIVEFTLILSS
jgi:hypothetical protein